MNHDTIRRSVPFVVPVLLIAAAWAVLIRPLSADSARAAREIETGRARLAVLRASLADPAPEAGTLDPHVSFERKTASDDAPAALLGHLTRAASAVGVRNLTIDSTSPPAPVASADGGPRAAGTTVPDPRLAQFQTPLVYSTIPMSFESSYEAAGELLWRLRSLPALVEIRFLEVRPRVDGTDDQAGASAVATDGTVSVRLTLIAYARAERAAGGTPLVGGSQ